MDVDKDLEELMGYLGEYGTYQRRQVILHIFAAITAGVHMLSLVTVAAIPEHRCLIPGEDPNNPYPWNSTEVKSAIPLTKDEKLDSCKLWNSGSNATIKCDAWVYDLTYYQSSRAMEVNGMALDLLNEMIFGFLGNLVIISPGQSRMNRQIRTDIPVLRLYLNYDNTSKIRVCFFALCFLTAWDLARQDNSWNFVCDRRWMGAVAQTAYMFGVFTGAATLGRLADKIGRKKVFYLSAVLQLIFGVSVAFVPEFYTFLIVRYLYGIFGSAGSYITGFVLTMELVGASKRTSSGVAFQAAFAGGLMLVAFWGWIIKDRLLLQVIYGLHSLLLIGHWWLIDESPSWLWTQGKTKEAVAIVQNALKINENSDLLDKERFLSKRNAHTVEEESAGVWGLLKTPNLRKKTLNVCLNWFANSLAYYGLSLSTGTLPGNPLLMLFVTGLVEFPSYVLTVLIMDKTGRRSLISSFMIIGGISCIIAALIPQETEAQNKAIIIIVMFGKFAIAGSFAIIYNYTAELFPTVVRTTAVGLGGMMARLSGAITPLLILLDSFDKTLPIMTFASIAIISGLLSLLLPETVNQPLPQSLEDGERFGIGDTGCTICFPKRNQKYDVPLSTVD